MEIIASKALNSEFAPLESYRINPNFYYTGVTEDLEKRLIEHNNKSLSFWTKRGSDWKLVYKEDYNNCLEAYKREKWLKTGVGREFIKEILKK